MIIPPGFEQAGGLATTAIFGLLAIGLLLLRVGPTALTRRRRRTGREQDQPGQPPTSPADRAGVRTALEIAAQADAAETARIAAAYRDAAERITATKGLPPDERGVINVDFIRSRRITDEPEARPTDEPADDA